jgi:hypothetical protein
MMRVKASQVAVWERDDLERWFAESFPERVIGKPREEVAAFLESRAAGARDLGFTRPSHLRYLLGYEIGCGIRWLSGAEEGPSAPVLRVLRERDVAPEARIEAAERLLYGGSDD